ncbi:centromere kinetochore component CENP-T-domain-containing protein [Bisporella sp. PMI_857]|nr:centromere kinetochore component CENP-T-domain-containing protein [Bisporella sp. PMI_857]
MADPAQEGTTPRISDENEAIVAAAVKRTPYNTLRQLPSITKPTTPSRRASSAGPPSQRSSRRTPSAGQRIGSAKRPNAVTPHGRAAIREIEARRAGLTPGKDRRRSGIQQRETPRNDLRALSRLLAPKTKPIVPTPPQNGRDSKPTRFERDDLDDEPDLPRPRLSMALDEDSDEDDSLLLPPRSAGLENDDYTGHSIELPRRAISEQPLGRLSRGSFGSIRLSDQFRDFNDNGLRGVFDSSFAMGGAFDDDEAPDLSENLPGEDTGTLRNLGLERGRESDIRPGVLGDDTENDFVFTVPPRDVPDIQVQPDPSDQSINNPFGEDLSGFELNEVLEADATTDQQVEAMDMDDAEESESDGSPAGSDIDLDLAVQDVDLPDVDTSIVEMQDKMAKRKKIKVSKHGIQYPSLPAGVVKKLATTYARTSGKSKAKISKDTLDAIIQATDWFFEQVSEDLGAYSKHAGRKTIDESDVITLMRRQRQTNATTTPFSLAQKFLPRELLQELRMED